MQILPEHLINAINAATENKQPLRIRGGGSKDFYGNSQALQHASLLDTSTWQGVVDYEPSELVITARAGTPLVELEKLLHDHGQMLAFEPPYFSASATLGGCVATGLSGPRRAYTGAVRDYVLGTQLLDGQGSILSFGGRVMKNVAGYDVSRLMTGAMGTLGVLLEISLKVLPKPAADRTLCFQASTPEAMAIMRRCATEPLPVSATCFHDDQLYVRLSGAESAVQTAHARLGGDEIKDKDDFWESVRNHTHLFFQEGSAAGKALWRLSIKPTTPPLSLPGKQLIEWGGALRWLVTDEDADAAVIRTHAADAGGHATLFHGDKTTIPVFHPLSPALLKIHQRLKQQFDPAGILNPQRMYTEF
ncbi:glycolate oxidase subunit GlcE [Nitrosomonas sp. HPC101]|uniref:glycolate oxidase subunit GlcE n=1 Tax=Nitrosomonas sp. HPC101 TaxID=1658667 RepID=UPI00136C1208|nr:glycolate oxidase subunit GlcE [Nitrosomonas sp. HPC101]MXS85527.1 glycolate oxidase subunit GlcE [Nitrosomonas sp. HPC101]